MAISALATLTILGGVGGLGTWSLYREMIMTTKLQQRDTIKRFAQEVDTYQEMYPPQESVTRAIDKYTRPSTWIQVQTLDGTLVGQSDLMARQPTIEGPWPAEPQVLRVSDRYWVACGLPMTLDNGSNVTAYIVDDVTRSYQAYLVFVRTMLATGATAMGVTTVVGLWLIRRSLRPLTRLSQITERISAEQLQVARVSLDDPPTEVEQLVGAYNHMLDRLSLSWEQKRQLISNISHELRTPLSIVQGYLESTLRRGQNLSDLQQESLSTALDETQRTVRLLCDLIDLARAESGAFHMKCEPVSLEAVARDTVTIASQIVPNPMSVRVVPPNNPLRGGKPDEIYCLADRDRLKQVLLNLLTNAGRYSKPDSPVEIWLEGNDRYARVSVRDRGIGIPPEHQQHIFERFFRVDEARSRNSGGTGLGLAIVAVLVEQMQGSISVESEPGTGSTFAVSLRRAPAPTRALAIVS
ncbi:MAG: HAMP domain-containing sensor histidine kinase [Cyanobacteria bacterium J06639_1]